MKVETLANLIRGELLNNPLISGVVSFTNRLDEVNRGSCFFSNDIAEIVKAIKKGAFAIVFEDEKIEILDEEIGWIRVKDFKKAIFDIFKYQNLAKPVYFTDKITSMIIDKMKTSKNIVVVNDYDDMFKAITFDEKYIILSDKDIRDNLVNIIKIEEKPIEIFYSTLFKSKFKTDKKELVEINLPFVYRRNFARAIYFFEMINNKYSLEFHLDRFKPIFINSSFEKVSYGQSDKVLIIGIKNDEFFFDEINYIVEHTKHARTLFVNRENEELLNERFNFAVLVDMDFDLKKVESKGLF